MPMPVFSVTKFGKPVLLYGGYRFNKYVSCKGPTARYVCNKWSSGCRAILNCLTIREYKVFFTTSKNGKPIIICGGNRFNQHSNSRGPKGYFVCIKRRSGCKATIRTIENAIYNTKLQHNHD
ncbi:Modifier of mdg4 [Operophtera brumata]|uniref:Modifier of mdg4 n=1 Tax=Operophtera brumata TaxID=104452 RepID=A0A0L7KJZ4_OPEBR|nr:Modifier of mdg4 [Operophtera brumata]